MLVGEFGDLEDARLRRSTTTRSSAEWETSEACINSFSRVCHHELLDSFQDNPAPVQVDASLIRFSRVWTTNSWVISDVDPGQPA